MGLKIKPLYIVAVIAILIVVYMGISYASVPVVAVGDSVSVEYTGTLTNGTVFDSSAGRGPLNFTVGSGQLIKGFDQGVVGMRLNEERNITIPANEAYGEVNPALIVQVPLPAFGNQTVKKGGFVARKLNGQQVQGVVTAVNATTVTVDFNSPLAGKTLIFKIKVVAIHKP